MKNHRYILALTFVMVAIVAHSQTPVLAADLNPGSSNGFLLSHNAYLGDMVIFSANNGVSGFEPYILKDGEITLLKDIAEGMSGSNPFGFINFNDRVYFSTFDSINLVSIWATDGTTTGTELIISYPDSKKSDQPRDFIVSKSNSLYFTIFKKLYRIDGTTQTVIEVPGVSNIDFAYETPFTGKSYSTYEDGIAFLTKDDKTIKLWKAEEEATLLSELITTTPWIDYFGISQVEGGIAFAINASFNDEYNGLYFYNRTTQILDLFVINNMPNTEIFRTMQFNDSKFIGLDYTSGYFSMNGNPDDTEILGTDHPGSFPQGDPIPHALSNGFLVFREDEATFSDIIVATDGTKSGTSFLAKTSAPYITDFISRGQFVFWASGVTNNFKPELWQANPTTGISKMLYKYDTGSKIPRSITPFCIQDDKYYFISQMDTAVGSELFYLQLDDYTNVDVIENRGTYSIIQQGNSITVASIYDAEEVNINIYDIQGRTVSQYTTITGSPINIDLSRNIYLIHVHGNKGLYSQKIFLGQ